MSKRPIAELREAAAFDPTPHPAMLSRLHVPFDDLTASQETEARLQSEIRSGGRVALVGGMGAGRSSVLAYSIQPKFGFAPLPISVAVEDDATVTEPGRFAQHVIRVVRGWAAEAELLSRKDRSAMKKASCGDQSATTVRRSTVSYGLTVQVPWLIRGHIARDVHRDLEAAASSGQSASQYFDALRRLMAIITTIDLTPVLVIDDSDRWLYKERPRAEIVEPFFGKVIRELASTQARIVVATHAHYTALDEYQSAVPGVLNSQIKVPPLTSRNQIARILMHRIETLIGNRHSIFEPAAVDRIWAFHARVANGNLRKTLQIAHTAIAEASMTGVENIGVNAVETVAAAWLD